MKLLLLCIIACCFAGSVSAGPLEDAERDLAASNSQLDTLCKRMVAAFAQADPSDTRQKQLFQQAQAAWAQYREAQSSYDAYSGSAGGVGFRFQYLRASTKLASERIKYLQELLTSAQP